MPGLMNAAISSKIFPATTHAGRINFKSSSDFNFIPATKSKPPAQFAFFQEAVVMAHHQMRFNLAHRVQQNTDRDQNTRAAKETRHGVGNAHLPRKNDWNRRN